MIGQKGLSPSVSAITEALLESLRTHDPYTYGHCRRVGRNALLLAHSAGLNPIERRMAEFAGLLHDIGKIGIPEHILRKQGSLTENEETIMRTHVQRSMEIVTPLAHIPFFRALLPGIRHHHERIDGLGYPNGLFSHDIPVIARIIAIVDAVDAITTRRPYRDQSPMKWAYRELQNHAGTQFDDPLARIFMQAHPAWKEDFQTAPLAPRAQDANHAADPTTENETENPGSLAGESAA